ncbi:ras-related protein Rap-2c-like [Haliotis asinina]|uniref:ras-related protein Rap-2c-like n=1 Tax=Haliotis asinina TaxID=109174 RepID=UPI003531977C
MDQPESSALNCGISEAESVSKPPSPVNDKPKLTDDILTVAVMGRACAGKTAILNQYIYKTFIDRYLVTVSDKHMKVVNVDGQQIELAILDTPGGYCFEYGRRQAIINADAFVLVYSVDEILSFQRALELMDSIAEKRGNGLQMVIVQTKTDIRKDKWFENCEILHTVIPDGLQLPHFQVSAKEGSDMSVIFDEVVQLMQSDNRTTSTERGEAAFEQIKYVLRGQQIWL